MKIVCIGDSLTEGDYGVYGKSGIANVNPKSYPYFLQLLTDANVENYGKCGYNSSSYLKYYKSGAVDVHNADKIIVMLGTNGGLDPNSNTQGNNDYDELIKLLRNDAPNAVIYLCTPPHATADKSKSNYGYAANVDNAVQFVREYSRQHNLKIIDLAKCHLFKSENEIVLQPNDGLHFSEVGYGIMALYIKDNL